MKKFILIFFIFTTVGCKRDGTDTGNPIWSSPVVAATDTYNMVRAACVLVTSCNTLNEVEACLTQQMTSVDYGVKFGLPVPNQTWTLQQIISAEVLGDIVPNNAHVLICVNDISQLNCADGNVVQAYDPLLSEPYQNLSGLLPASCQSAFSP